MSVWLERFALTVLAALLGATVLTNPWQLDRIQQSALVVAIVALSVFAARTIENMRRGPASVRVTATSPDSAVDHSETTRVPALRQLDIKFSVPVVGSPIEVVSVWENTSDHSIVVRGHATVYTIGLADGERLPIRPETEDSFEAFGWQQQQAASPRDNSAEIPPGSQVATRYTSDPSRPVTAAEIAELRLGRARVYAVGEEHWQINGADHGCEYCVWTSGDGRPILGRRRNRCF